LYSEVLVFACNWGGWSCIEAAANLGLHYPATVKVVKVSCLSRLHTGLILKPFEMGAAGVMLLGCEPGNCHFGIECKCTVSEYEKARGLLEILGIEKDRLVLLQLPVYSGRQFVERLADLTEKTGGTLVSEGVNPGRDADNMASAR
jgi:coenzyme F420-reducing hydrogenase delta subunit